MITGIPQSAGSGLFDMLRSLQAEQKELLEASTAETLTAQVAQTVNNASASSHAASSNLMSRNFFNADYQHSQYVQASIDGKQLEDSYSNKMNSMLNSLVARAAIWDLQRHFGGPIAGCGGPLEYIENTYVNGNRLSTAASQATNRIKQEEASEASEDNLDEIKEEIERKAQEATAPTDANGQPIETGTTGSTGQAAAPMPESSGSNPAPAADMAPPPAPAASVAAAPAPDVAAAPAAPTRPSIDILV